MWRRASACNGSSSCLELKWIKALSCNNANCLEVAYRQSSASATNGECVEAGVCSCGDTGQVWVRDSKHQDGNTLRFEVADWQTFVDAIKAAELDGYSGPVRLEQQTANVWFMWHEVVTDAVLVFSGAEIEAFTAGVRAMEFEPDALMAPRRPPAQSLPNREASQVSV